MSTIDALVVGRHTFELAKSFAGWPYGKTPVFVLSTRTNGVTIQRFLADGLIDEVTITRIPVLIGAGRLLFGPLASDVSLEHISTRAYEFGFVQSRYRVFKRESRYRVFKRTVRGP